MARSFAYAALHVSTCPRCAGPLDPATAAYDERGDLVCRTCFSNQTAKAATALVTAKDPTTTRNLYGGAVASSFLGLVTCVASGLGIFFFLAAPIPIFSGAATLRALFGDPTARARLGAGYFAVIALCIAGIGFGCLAVVVGLLMMVLSESLRLHVH
jgi:hypothetical protein